MLESKLKVGIAGATKLKLDDILDQDKIELKPSGNGRRVAICPFHEGDRDPSFTVYPNETYFCFGCRAWGDALKWLVDYRKMSHREALDLLGVDYHMRKPKSVIKIRNTYKTYPFLGEAAARYHAYLMGQPGALSYLKQRGLTLETITRYKLGYTDGRVLDLRYAAEHELAQSVGLVTDKGYELLSHRIIVPNLIENNLCDFMIGRTVLHDKVKYLGLRAPKPIYGLYEQRTSPVLFMTEGHFDYLLLRQWGYPTIVAGGTHATDTNLGLLKHRKIIYVPDNDDEGLSAAVRMEKSLSDVTILNYKDLKVKDVGELALQEGGQQIFEMAVREQLSWIWSMSQTTLARYFPNLIPIIPSPSI